MINQDLYYTWFYLQGDKGNNSFVFPQYPKTHIYIAPLIQGTTKDLKIWERTVFQETNSKWNLTQSKGLLNFIHIKNKQKNIYIFDNHNHALYFRYKELLNNNIQKGIKLIHIDQHTDMNENKNIIENTDLKNIFEFTNEKCNVWNFIKPAIEEWLLWKVEQITTEYKLLNFEQKENEDYILDIDIDFRDPKMSIEKQEKTIQKTRKLIKQAKLITIATSPYFMDQKEAIKIIKALLKNGD